jgi:hypothetical protein
LVPSLNVGSEVGSSQKVIRCSGAVADVFEGMIYKNATVAKYFDEFVVGGRLFRSV